jgi:uncharacterized protein
MPHGDWKALFKAVEEDNLEEVKYYVRSGVDFNYQHPEYLTNPLFECIRLRHYAIIKYFLENDAQLEVREISSGDTPVKLINTSGDSRIKALLNKN